MAGCQIGLPQPAPQLNYAFAPAPPGAKPGTCWGRHDVPAVIETVTEQIMLQPAEVMSDGTVLAPAVFKTETRQQILRERRETWFERPCDDVMTPEFIATLQRALAARGHYSGAVSGEMSAKTLRAIRAYQAAQGLDSAVLSLAAARKLGLIAVARSEG
ncbi:peptidoglycan-binding domain-containing protein [Litorivita sp. NS0012-18]|uniref:peptidoglycan-binding domain-containing protein n=1 Tax=Litorivita sp. NS0012-18 TaxID=3127655 RepID=UPI00334033BF